MWCRLSGVDAKGQSRTEVGQNVQDEVLSF
jgi:hypothetical protein